MSETFGALCVVYESWQLCSRLLRSTRPEERPPFLLCWYFSAHDPASVVVDFEVVQFRDTVFDWNLFKFMQLSGVKPSLLPRF